VTSAQAYRLLALSPIDPQPETWRWQRAGHLVTVLLRKIALHAPHWSRP